MLLKRLLAVYSRFFRQPWHGWGGCTDPDLARYVMDYALGWLDNPRAVPELADKARDLRVAFAAHLNACRRCQENVRAWQAPLEPPCPAEDPLVASGRKESLSHSQDA